MSTAEFNPPELVSRFNSGEWDEDPVLMPCHQYILKKQSEEYRLTDDYRLWLEMQKSSAHRNNPALKKQADTFFSRIH
jgi:hypothetical protein